MAHRVRARHRRAETKIRHAEVPVAPVDFMSEYPTVAALMDLMEILRAKKLTFEDATSEVQTLLESMHCGKVLIDNVRVLYLFPSLAG